MDIITKSDHGSQYFLKLQCEAKVPCGSMQIALAVGKYGINVLVRGIFTCQGSLLPTLMRERKKL